MIIWRLVEGRAFFPGQKLEVIVSGLTEKASPAAVPGNMGFPAFGFPFSRSVVVADFFFCSSVGVKSEDHRNARLGKAGDAPHACGGT
mgnify:CR=1 FL=1